MKIEEHKQHNLGQDGPAYPRYFELRIYKSGFVVRVWRVAFGLNTQQQYAQVYISYLNPGFKYAGGRVAAKI